MSGYNFFADLAWAHRRMVIGAADAGAGVDFSGYHAKDVCARLPSDDSDRNRPPTGSTECLAASDGAMANAGGSTTTLINTLIAENNTSAGAGGAGGTGFTLGGTVLPPSASGLSGTAAGLDVFENEPAVEPELLTMENVVLLPHIASASLRTRTLMATMASDNIVAYHHGQRPPNILNPEVLE